ncbi:MAG: amino acid adenylation domain-containing protein [Deltaproteobacteria bacterium]|nr:MAG: amino acid adenylation domain-containing protein [Deltaproteobacteria bacterium]
MSHDPPASATSEPSPSGSFRASSHQQRLWTEYLRHPDHTAYKVVVVHRVEGDLDVARLHAALQAVADHHEGLRSLHRRGPDGALWLDPQPRLEVPCTRESEVDDPVAFTRRVQALPLSLEHGSALRLGVAGHAGDHLVVLVLHHLVFDGACLPLLYEQWSQAFRGESLAPSASLRQWLGEQPTPRADQVAVLADALADVELGRTVEGPVDERTSEQHVVEVSLASSVTERLALAARALGATRFELLSAAWLAVLRRYTGESSVLSTYAVRRAPPELMAFLVDNPVVCGRFSPESTLADLVGQVHAQRQADDPTVGLADLMQELRARRQLAPGADLARVSFSQVHLRRVPWELSGLAVAPIEPPPAEAMWDLLLEYDEVDGLRFRLSARAARYPRAWVEQLGRHWATMVGALVDEPGQRVDAVQLLSREERRRVLVAPNQTRTPYPRDATVADLLEAALRDFSASIAVVEGDARFTYAQLSEAACALARALRSALGDAHRPGLPVALRCEPGWPSVVAMCGVVLADCAYLPLSATDPAARHAALLDHAEAVVCSPGLALDTALPCVSLGAGEAGPWPRRRSGPLDPVYRMTTSGSTGTPKATEVPHRGVVRLLFGADGWCQLGPEDRVLQAADLAFDAATFEVWGALLHGGTLVCAAREQLLEPVAFARLLEEHRISAMFLTSGLFHRHAAADPAMFGGLRVLIVGGDVVDPDLAGRVLAAGGPTMLDGYGPTENTTFSAVGRVVRGEAPIPIGPPIANSTAYVLDAGGQPTPPGVAGELFVGGDGVAIGYAGDAERTAERFGRDPFLAEVWPGSEPGRMYRTGDRARWLDDGRLLFLGRVDDQVKIRGFRIEPGEVEARLRAHPQVADGVVVVQRAPAVRLVAWYVGEVTAEDLRAWLAAGLPEAAVPAHLFAVGALPTTRTGKVDRRALAARDLPAASPEPDDGRDPASAALAGLWCDVLGTTELHGDPSFFEVGGDSLKAIELSARVRASLGRGLSVAEVFANPRLSEMAAVLATRATVDLPEPVASGTSAPDVLPLSHFQRGHWFLLRRGKIYPTVSALRVFATLEPEAVGEAWTAVLGRHEVPWLTVDAGEPVMHRQAVGSAEVEWLTGGEPVARLRERVDALTQTPYVEAVPCVRLLACAHEESTWLAVFAPHALLDGFGLDLFLDQLLRELEGERPPAAPLPLHDYLAWERQVITPERVDAACDYYERRLVGDARMRLPSRALAPRTHGALGRCDHDAVRAHARLAADQGVTLEAALTYCAFLTVHLAFDQHLVRCLSAYSNRDLLGLRGLPAMLANGLFQQSELVAERRFSEASAAFARARVETFPHARLPPMAFFGMSRLLYLRGRLAHLPGAGWFGQWWSRREAGRSARMGAYFFDLVVLSVVYVLWRGWHRVWRPASVPTIGCFINVTTQLGEPPQRSRSWRTEPVRFPVELPESVPGNAMLDLFRDESGVRVFFQGLYTAGVPERFVALFEAVVAWTAAHPEHTLGELRDALGEQGRAVFRDPVG